jgi:uncharacterized membrane protein YraQ (UPF0718 family)
MSQNACHHHCSSSDQNDQIQIGKPLKITGLIFVLVFALSFLPFLAPLNESLLDYLSLIWWAILLGLLIGGIIDYFIPEGFIFKYLGQKGKQTCFYAVIAGFLLSACSHGILAIAIQLYKKGASIPAVITFLLASPWANLPVTILLFGFFGLQALWLIIGAMVIALMTGYIYMGLDKYGLIEPALSIEHEHQNYEFKNIKHFQFKDALKGILRGSIQLADMVLWWILIGFLLAAFISAYVPEYVFMQYMGTDFLGILTTLVFATIIEVCSEGSSPIAFEIFNKLGVLGNTFVFLMAGVATDYTEIGLLWSNIGKKTAMWLPVISVPLIVLFGIIFNMISV